MSKNKELPVVKLTTKKARQLADFAGIHEDLRTTVRMCELLLTRDGSGEGEDLVKEALWIAALVNYVRCFAEGKRYGLTEDALLEAGDKAIEVHRFLVEVRNKHIAHSVNPLEQVEVGVVLSEPDAVERKVESVVTTGIRLVSMNAPAARGLLTLAATLLDQIKLQAKRLESEVGEEASRIPYDELLSYPPITMKAPRAKDAGTARK